MPSYTEAHPKVIDEALSRVRPVIIFDEIKHVINGRLGVISSERNPDKLKEYRRNYYLKKKNEKLICQDNLKN